MVEQLTTIELIEKVRNLMINHGYSETTIGRYSTCWNALMSFEKENDIAIFTAKTAMIFLEKVYGITTFTHLTKTDGIRARAIQFLCDYKEFGECRLMKRRKNSLPKEIPWNETLLKFKNYRKEKNLISDSTIKKYDLYIGQFLRYLKSNSVENLEEITLDHILNYTIKYGPLLKTGRHNAFSSIRAFLRHLFEIEGIMKEDLSHALPSVSYKREAKLPAVYQKDEVNRLLGEIDRSTPLGKRDYAIILIAVRLGLRSSDIRNMTFSCIDWNKNTIELITQKTQKPTVLPLLKDVGEALIDYIRNGRPTCETKTIFVRQAAPFIEIGQSGLSAIVKKYANKAGIDCSVQGKGGPHAMRNTLATHLLENNVPLPVISEILTHSSTRTTETYLKLDVPHLRQCCLEVPSFDWNKNREEVF